MNKRIRFLSLVIFTFFFAISSSLCFSQTPAQNHVPGEVIVKLKANVPPQAINGINKAFGTSTQRFSALNGFHVLNLPANVPVDRIAQALSNNPNVEYAEANYIAHAHAVPNDEFYPYQWHLDNPVSGGINAEKAWDIAQGTGVVVAVIDSGVSTNGSDSFAHIAQGYDFANNDNDPTDDNGHGTHVAGTIAQNTNNTVGVAGVAYDCTVLPVKVLGANGSGSYGNIADGIVWAADNGAQVINMSLGGGMRSRTLEKALQNAYNKGVTIICSSGNDSSNKVGYPAAYNKYCIAVGATRFDENIAYYSNTGSALDITAPGGDVTVDQDGDGYADGVLQQTFENGTWGYYFFQGTSMSSPHVAGVAALVISAGAGTTPDEVREALQNTAKDKGAAGWDSAYGHGIVDAYAAVTYSGTVTPPPEEENYLLSANAKVKGKNITAKLSWTGATAPTIDIYRSDDGGSTFTKIATTDNTGSYNDRLPKGTTGTFFYYINDNGTDSNIVSVTF